jgi:RNA polymerase sigma-70 factor (ECF subfamily)
MECVMDGARSANANSTTVDDQAISEEQSAQRLVSRAVRRAQAGDSDAFGFLYARFADDVYGYVRSIVHDHHEAEDVTQHVFAKLVRVIGSYKEREVPFIAWMLRVARNAAVDHVRQRRPVPVEEVRNNELDGGDSHQSERINDLKDALATLPPAQREVLVLRHFAGLTPVEIAERTGKSEGSIHGLHHRGRKALWAELISRDAGPVTRTRIAESRKPATGRTRISSSAPRSAPAARL